MWFGNYRDEVYEGVASWKKHFFCNKTLYIYTMSEIKYAIIAHLSYSCKFWCIHC